MDALIRLNDALRSARAKGVTVVLALLALAICATPAGAVIEQVNEGAETVEVGVMPRKPAPVVFPAKALQWHGGPIDSATYVYALYWDPVKAYRSDWMRLIDGFLHNVGADSGSLENVFALNAQYRSATDERASYKVTFRGAYTDVTPYPASGCAEPEIQPQCLTDAQIRAELKRFVAAEHLPSGREVVYYVLTPEAVTVCLDAGAGSGNCSTSDKELKEEEEDTTGLALKASGFCNYHSVIEPGTENPIVYAVQPWVAGHAGHVLNEIPVENLVPTGAALACQNGKKLVEPNQRTSFTRNSDYETGLADLIIGDLSLEQADIMDDPMLSNGWFQEESNAEQSDMCRWVFGAKNNEEKKEEEKKKEGTEAETVTNQTIGGQTYYLQFGYDSTGISSGHGATCWDGVELIPHFTATNVVKGGDVVAFDALESSMTLAANLSRLKSNEPFTAPVYEWQFGDGSSAGPTGEASVFHTYQYAGNYTVTLKVTDSGGYTHSFSAVTPVGSPPAPSPPPPPTPGVTPPAGSSGGSSGAAGSGVTPGSSTTGAPAITQSVLSRSLKKAVQLGLAIHYNVNEQVAGNVEALLDSATAARLRIKGRTATGLPKGYPRETVIASKVLVTTRAGQGTLRIKFPATIAKRLAKARRVKLTLRFVLRNKSAAGVHTTTTFSTVVLSH
ncbi:MAG: PKD domain-containing protein [Solirubrobacteraceae bacterium]